MGVSAETAEEVDPEKEVWAVPPAYLRRPTLQPRECRKMAGGLVNIVRSEQVTKSDGVGAWIQDTHYSYKQAAPMAVAWRQVEQWLLNRDFKFSVENSCELAAMTHPSAWPVNLRLAKQLNPGLEFPGGDLPSCRPGEEEWRFFPLQVPPPVSEGLAEKLKLHKSVPRWSSGWVLEWHGSSLYGVSSALSIGEVLASEVNSRKGFGTACGRGAYASRSHAVATKYATTHFFGDYRKPEHNFVVKAVVLCAIPGSTPEALPEAMWTHVPKDKRKHGRAFELDVQDDRLDKSKMRLVDSGTSREKDWTCQNPAEYFQTTSSRAYTIGLAIGVMEALRANHYGQEGAKKKLTTGWEEKAELPLARPRRLREES